MSLAFIVLGGSLLGLPRAGYAQLISPGRLSEAHADLEGITNCTNCHTLGQRGIDNARCLNCHEPLRTRIEAGRGFHATVAEQNCASCHKEHFGRDFDAIRFDTTAFDHQVTGFALVGGHTEVTCRGCHQPDYITAADVRAFKGEHQALARTFLGLGTECQTCHTADDPHQGQFTGQDCQTCHTEVTWDEAPRFDHAQARFTLTGLHREVNCASCHPTSQSLTDGAFVRYTGLDFASCASCHDDVHQGAMGAACADCHSTSGWRRLDQATLEARFDHDATGFPLVGRHATVACASCHGRPAPQTATIRIRYVAGTEAATYPHPQATTCTSCHADYHEGAFDEAPGGATCDNCHTEAGWLPTTYDIDRHNQETRFALTGAHVATPCFACHHNPDLAQGAYTFAFADTTCQTCHAADNPHGVQFADQVDDAQRTTACAECHTTTTWRFDQAAFDHGATGFPLTGRHAAAACVACHTEQADRAGSLVTLYRDLPQECAACHADEDPHQGQFDDTSCGTCHDAVSFRIAAFDHSRTAFPLEGAHRDVACVDCHPAEQAPDGTVFTRFKPLGTACIDCHSDP